MATLKTVSEPTYTLELNAMELRALQALVGATSGNSLATALNTVFMTEYSNGNDLSHEFPAINSLWRALEPKDRR